MAGQDSGRLTLTTATDEDALEALQWLARSEGIIPALESAHAVAAARVVARELGKDGLLVVNVSGRGDKDVEQVRKALAAADAGAGAKSRSGSGAKSKSGSGSRSGSNRRKK